MHKHTHARNAFAPASFIKDSHFCGSRHILYILCHPQSHNSYIVLMRSSRTMCFCQTRKQPYLSNDMCTQESTQYSVRSLSLSLSFIQSLQFSALFISFIFICEHIRLVFPCMKRNNNEKVGLSLFMNDDKNSCASPSPHLTDTQYQHFTLTRHIHRKLYRFPRGDYI